MANLKDVKSKNNTIKLLDGVERVIKFDLNAMAELEDKYGSVEAAFEALEKNSIKALRFILWAGLVHEDESLTERQVGSLIDMKYMQDIMDNLGEALESDMPSEEEDVGTTEGTDPN